ncbi:MAG: iron-containing alcohol dehydrogenase [Gammaproteobacteria bacterium]|jgi:NADP-dependent alcohol dehydrogenase
MQNFEFYNPVKIFFGEGEIAKLEQEIPADKRILLTYGGGSIKRNTVYDQVMTALKNHDVIAFGGIEPNPRYETLMKAVEIVRDKKIDFLLAVGGGSVLDGTKFIAAAAKYPNDPWNFMQNWGSIKDALPLGAVLTLPATGSEMNCGSVVTREETKEKLAFRNPLVFPKFSILDPTTTFTLPPHQTANGVIDTFVHVTEQYLTFPANAPLQDRFAESILLTLLEEGPKAMANSHDYDARANIMWCATMALNGLLSMGVPTDWATHIIGHEITAKCGLDHGQTLAIILPSLLYIKRGNKHEKLLQYAERVWQITQGSEEEKIISAINKTREFFESLGVKTRLSEYKIKANVIPSMLASLESHGFTALGERQDIDLKEIEEIYKASL